MTRKRKTFPPSWLDDQGNVKCVARGCDQVWRTSHEMKVRHSHLRNILVPEILVPETLTDHNILIAMSKQRRCPYCQDYALKSNRSVNELHQHVLREHHREDTATISGFVKLLRYGMLEPEVACLAYEPAHQRLLQELMASPDYYGPWGLAHFWHLKDPNPDVNRLVLELMITKPNENEDKPLYYPMAPDKFLSHLPPQFNERQHTYDWAGLRSRLRQRYANGEI